MRYTMPNGRAYTQLRWLPSHLTWIASAQADPGCNELRNPGPPAGVSAIQKEGDMDTTTLLIIIVVLLVLGGGWYGRGRWY
jgi:hypothetical protein